MSEERRRFSPLERAVLYLDAEGHCILCGDRLPRDWHADHRVPYSAGGPTRTSNGQALCPPCNLKKGSTVADNPYDWQQMAAEKFLASSEVDFLVSATPGSGKTRFAIDQAAAYLAAGRADSVVVVVPTDALREQWVSSASSRGVHLFPVSGTEGYVKPDYSGCVVTYSQLSSGDGAATVRDKTLRHKVFMILDEVHHAGDNESWGDALRIAGENAEYRLHLTGTPWRRDPRSPIPFQKYDPDTNKVEVNFAYEYGAAVADGVCRRIEFSVHEGDARWIDTARARREGRDQDDTPEFTAHLSGDMAEGDVSAALDAVYNPGHAWISSMLEQADEMLSELRTEVPDAAGLVICERQWYAKEYAKLLKQITGTTPPVVVSDSQGDPGGKRAKRDIDTFRKGTGRWIIAVKMISEGVDIPRLAIGLYASKVQTPLFFRQVVGRFVRTRPDEEFNARLLIPAVPELLKHAKEIEEELRHELELSELREGPSREQQADRQWPLSLSATDQEFAGMIVGGDVWTPEDMAWAENRCRSLGSPISHAITVLRSRSLDRAGREPEVAPTESAPKAPVQVRQDQQEKLIRGEIVKLVNQYCRLTGKAHQEVNFDLSRMYGSRKSMTLSGLKDMQEMLSKTLAGLG